jgi:aspartyl protease family protein
MALSAGMRQTLGVAASWLAVACTTDIGLVYFNEIRGVALSAPGLQLREVSPGADRPAGPVHTTPHTAPSQRIVEIKAGAHGHYYASAEVNGRPIEVLVDSGASIVALTYDDAARAGVSVHDSNYTQRVSTANGLARVAPVVLDRISLGAITIRNVPAAVAEPGRLATSLLGMSFLARLQRVDMRAGTLTLQE